MINRRYLSVAARTKTFTSSLLLAQLQHTQMVDGIDDVGDEEGKEANSRL